MSETFGRGFVHLNTPASINYTKNHTVSLSELIVKKRRVETVQLPPWIKDWRVGKRQFVQHNKDYKPFARDAEAERQGNGIIYPTVLQATPSTNIFFCDDKASLAEVPKNGIKIVSHHKLTGAVEFTYPDYDGVLQSGPVPEVVLTDEERQRLEAEKGYYISPLDMTEEEARALEELQMLWKSRSTSRSAEGQQIRSELHICNTSKPRAPHEAGKERKNDPAAPGEEEEEVEEEEAVNAFDEALRLADELLRYA